MRFTVLVAMLICSLAVPAIAWTQDIAPMRPANGGALLRSGVVVVQRLEQERVAAAQLQQTKLKSDKTTTIIVVSVVATAVVIYLLYQLNHSGPFISGHF